MPSLSAVPISPGSTEAGDESTNNSLEEEDEGYQEPGAEYNADGEYILAAEPSQRAERDGSNQSLIWPSR